MRKVSRSDLILFAKHLSIVAASIVAAYVVLAMGSLALSSWGPGRSASGFLFLIGSGVIVATILAAYPYSLWLASRRSGMAAATVLAVGTVALTVLVIALSGG